MARTAKIAKSLKKTEIQCAHTQPLPLLRPRTRVYSQVPDVPNLFSRYGAEGEIPGVVKATVGQLCRRSHCRFFDAPPQRGGR